MYVDANQGGLMSLIFEKKDHVAYITTDWFPGKRSWKNVNVWPGSLFKMRLWP